MVTKGKSIEREDCSLRSETLGYEEVVEKINNW
jgi:hypothetical protein